jgi:hypothetical protein
MANRIQMKSSLLPFYSDRTFAKLEHFTEEQQEVLLSGGEVELHGSELLTTYRINPFELHNIPQARFDLLVSVCREH